MKKSQSASRMYRRLASRPIFFIWFTLVKTRTKSEQKYPFRWFAGQTQPYWRAHSMNPNGIELNPKCALIPLACVFICTRRRFKVHIPLIKIVSRLSFSAHIPHWMGSGITPGHKSEQLGRRRWLAITSHSDWYRFQCVDLQCTATAANLFNILQILPLCKCQAETQPIQFLCRARARSWWPLEACRSRDSCQRIWIFRAQVFIFIWLRWSCVVIYCSRESNRVLVH